MDARKILSCVYRLDERRLHFGKIVVAAVLTGSKSEQIGRFSLHTLSTYGIMSEQTAVRVRQLIDVLLERGLLTADPERYNALFLTKTGNALMRGRGELHIRLPREKKPETVRRTEVCRRMSCSRTRRSRTWPRGSRRANTSCSACAA